MVDRVGQFGRGARSEVDATNTFEEWVELPSYRPSFGALLVRSGIASDSDVKDALEEGLRTGERLGEVVIRRGWATEERIAELLAEQWQLPFAEADGVVVDPNALNRVPLAIARELKTLPIGFDGPAVLLAIEEPSEGLFSEVKKRIGEASFVVVPRSVLAPLINGSSPERAVASDAVDATGAVDKDESATTEPAPPATVAVEADGSSESPEGHEPSEPSWAVEDEPELPGTEEARDHERLDATEPEVREIGEVTGVMESIATVTTDLERLRREVEGLADSLTLAKGRISEQEAALAAAAETHRRDAATIRELESELSQRADLFETLKGQIATLTETLEASPDEDRDAGSSGFGQD
jgi:MshEN domain